MKVNSVVDYIFEICPRCLRDTNLTAEAVCACGLAVPKAFVIPYEAQWDFYPDLMPLLQQHDALRLMGRFGGKQPERIAELRHVRYLYLSRYPAIDLRLLAAMENLDILELDYGHWTTLDGIEALPNLRSLLLTECRKLVDASALARCRDLRILGFTLCAGVTQFGWLHQLKSLGYFRVEGKSLDDLNFVEGLDALQVLIVSARIKSRDVLPLLGLRNLQRFCTSRANVPKPMQELLHQEHPSCEVVLW